MLRKGFPAIRASESVKVVAGIGAILILLVACSLLLDACKFVSGKIHLAWLQQNAAMLISNYALLVDS